jgi:spermidine/putrescine transport system ATP-binding protein
MTAPLLRLRGLSKSYGGTDAVEPTDLDVEAGTFTAILGPSGCGKSTLLRMIGGFVPPTSGTIEIDGHDVSHLGPEKRPTNMVFQNHGLFPHLSVVDNVGFGLSIAKRPIEEIHRRVSNALALVQLTDKAGAGVDQLSGGQQQRVALARAIIMRPKILLLDEPLSALDLKLRQSMQMELKRIHREIGGTFLFVTHDQGEAFSLADRLVVMNAGHIEQIGTAHDVYRKPTSLFVARFVGDVNVLEDGPVPKILRPESIRLSSRAEPGSQAATLLSATQLGATCRCELQLQDGTRLIAQVPDIERTLSWLPGQILYASWKEHSIVGVKP